MTPEARLFFDKARKLLADAGVMLTVDLNEAAARTAYLAGFHAAQAFISEKLDKTVKTHRGVQAELYRLTNEDPSFPAELRPFLSQTYNLKAVADYDTDPASEVSAARAAAAVESARRFVDHFEHVLSARQGEAERGT